MAKKASVTVSVGGEVGDFAQAMDSAAASYQEFENILKRGKATFEATRTPAERYEMEVAKLNQELREGAISQDTFNRAVGQARNTLRSAQSSTSAFSGSLSVASGVLAGMGVSFSLRSVVSQISSSIAAAEEAVKADKKLEAVLRSTGNAAGFNADQLKQYASALQQVTNFGDETTISAQAVLATFTKIRGDVFTGAIRAAMNMSAVLDQDLKSSVLQLGKALNDPISGITALRRAGVSFTEQQKEQIRTLVESGDVLGAQKIILKELEVEFGGAAEAMRSPIDGLKNNLGDLSEEFGKLFTQTEAARTFWDVMSAGTRKAAEDLKNLREQGLGQAVVDKAQGIAGLMESIGKAVTGDPSALKSRFNPEAGPIEAPQPGALGDINSAIEDEEAREEAAKQAADAQEELAKALEKTRKELEQIGMTDAEKKLADMRSALGIGPLAEEDARKLAELEEALKSLDKTRADTKAADEAARKAESDAKKLASALENIARDAQTAGMSDADKKLFDLKEAGASDEQLGQARQGLEAAEAAKKAAKEQERMQREQEKMAADAKKMAEGLRTPAEQYNAEVADANAKLNEGLIDAVTHQRALAKAAEDYQKAMQKSAGATGAMEKGSKEAFGFIEEARRKAAAQVPLPLGANTNLPMPPGETVGPGGPTAVAPGGLGGGPQRDITAPPLAPGGLGGKQPSLKELMDRGAQAAPGGLGGGPQRVLPGLPDLSNPPIETKLPPLAIPDKRLDPVGFAEGMAERARRAVEEAQARGPRSGPSTMPLPELDKSLDPEAFANRAAERARRQVENARARMPELKDTPGMRGVEGVTNRMGNEDSKEVAKNTSKANEELAGVNRKLEKLVNKSTSPPAASLNV